MKLDGCENVNYGGVQLAAAHSDHLVVEEVQWEVDWEGGGEGEGVQPFLDRITVADDCGW